MEAHSPAKRQEAYRMWESGEKKSVIARSLQIDYDTLLGWIKRFKAEGVSGMELRYHRCGRPRVIDDKVKAKAIALRQAHAGWGCPYIRLQLVQEFGASSVASVRHIHRWLKAAGLMESKTRLPAVAVPWAKVPLARVQVDAKEQLKTADGLPCCYLNFTDENSGAVLDAFVFPLRPHQPSTR
ncbi:MAG: helix-turn-helix domain-containing protein [Saprospiraceae bacterium]|nr:helix-turn-helix domain-containing protein [Saprospiraceae bacterium]